MSRIEMITSFLIVMMMVQEILMAPTTTPPPSDPRRRMAIINYGRTLSREASAQALKSILQFNNDLRQYANTIPLDSMLHEFVVPLQFGSNIGNIAAPYVVKRYVERPIQRASVAIADYIDRIGATSDTLANFITNTFGLDGGDRRLIRRDIDEIFYHQNDNDSIGHHQSL